MSLELADALVRRYLTDEGDAEGSQPASSDINNLEGVEVVEGLIYQYTQIKRDTAVQLQVYLGLGQLGGSLWEQAVRVLMRVGGMEHRALPTVVDGGYEEADDFLSAAGMNDGFGYIRTLASGTGADNDADIANMVAHYHADKTQALRQFWLLADALAILHDSRIAHRNLWPGVLGVDDTGESAALRLGRFEFSTMLSSLMRASSTHGDGRLKVKNLYLDQGVRSNIYSPPERLRFLLAGDNNGDLGGPPGDVFGLGMIAAEWFLGPTAFSVPSDDFDNVRSSQESVRDRLNADLTLPRELVSLLRDMISERGRPTMSEVMRRISALYPGAASIFSHHPNELPYLLLFQPDYTDRTLLSWNEIENSATTPEGVEDVRRLILDDVVGAPIVVSTDGAVPYVREGREADRRRATTVVFGDQFIWFCEKYWRATLGSKTFYDEAQVIKYVVRQELAGYKLRELLINSPFARKLPAVEVITDKLQQVMFDRKRAGRPSWDELLATAPEAKPIPLKVSKFLGAIDFLLSYQEALLQAHRYPYHAELGESGHATLRFDAARDRARTAKLPALQSKLVADDRVRPAFADFFAEAVDDGSGRVDIDVWGDRNGAPGERVASYPLVEVRGRDQIILEVKGRGSGIPSDGWVCLSTDGPESRALRRQGLARVELGEDALLLSQLLGDRAIRGRKQTWTGSTGSLEGDGAEAVFDVLANEGLFAVQGPPGTGKTELSSEAIAAYLRRDQTARLLVSAQSHDALDNLGLRILDKLGSLRSSHLQRDWIPLRVASNRTLDRVHKQMQPYLLTNFTESYMRGIQRRLDERLASNSLLPEAVDLVREWRGQVDRAGFEMARRLRRGANLVFATCGACTREALVDDGTPDPFDWVFIEEAAKAWPTELTMALVRGRRWTLVGDQAQIGAYAKQDVRQFLDSCAGDPNPEIREHFDQRHEYVEAFDLFASIFNRRHRAGGARQLVEQRRMRQPIAEVVGRAFYPQADDSGPTDGLPKSSLVTKRLDDDHGLWSPPWVRGRALLWLDTRGVHRDRGFWTNEYEAAIVARFIRSLKPAPLTTPRSGVDEGKTLAVITPYRDQVKTISAAIPEASSAVWTIDSFQGRQADIVVVSLVRDTPRSDLLASKNIGHLVDAARVNVALSRARDLLVVVGRFDHYAGSGVHFWEVVTKAVEEFGTVRSAENLD